MVFDRTVKRLNNDQLGNIANAKTVVWNETTNTLTVTFGSLAPGSPTSVSVNARPSGVADSSSPLLMHATMTGTAQGGALLSQAADSAPITMPAGVTFVPVTPGSVSFASTPVVNAYPGNTPPVVQHSTTLLNGQMTQFSNLQIVTRWTEQAPGTQPIPPSWLSNGLNANGDTVSNCSSSQNDAIKTVYSCGAEDANFWTNFTFKRIPVGTPAGAYSVRYTLEDDRDGTGLNHIVVTTGTLTVNILDPAATNVGYNSLAGTAQAAVGGLFDWTQIPGAGVSAGVLKDMTVTLPIPAGAIPRSFQNSMVGVQVKAVQYTTDSAPNDSSTWQALPMSGSTYGRITLANPETITAIRYVLADFTNAIDSSNGRTALTLQVADAVAPGTVLPLVTQSVTYTDPVVGATSVTPTGNFSRSVTVVADGGNPALAGAFNGTAGSAALGSTVANGTPLVTQLWTGGSGINPVKQPYQFFLVPKGVDVAWNWTRLFSNYQGAFPYSFGSGSSNQVYEPLWNEIHTSVKLSDGSTLVYALSPNGELGRGYSGVTSLLSNYTITPRTALAGTQPVVLGVGSLSQNTFDTSAKNQAGFDPADLSADASLGAYAGVAGEVRSALAAAGITTNNALLRQSSFEVSPSTSVGVSTSVQGSEDTSPVVSNAANNYSGVGTARPGGSTKYQVAVTNNGSAEYENFQFVDVLPYLSDAYTLNPGVARGSQFDVNLSDNVKVQINGTPSSAISIETSTSATPPRFDSAGAPVAGTGSWTPFTGTTTGVKALRVQLTGGTKFRPGDTVTLSFDATVPASAPRDGSVAKNTVAYRFDTGGVAVASESPAVAVKSTAPAGDIELAGQSFVDTNSNGLQSAGESGLNAAGVSLQLYKMVAGSPVAQGAPVVPNTDAGSDGKFSFIGLTANDTYRVKPVITNPNVQVPAAALDGDGFLKYLQVTDAAANAPSDTSSYVGSSSFRIGDAAGTASHWIKDLRLPLTAKTTISGSVILNDKNGADISSVLGNALKDYGVALVQGAPGAETTIATTKTDVAGAFSFADRSDLLPGDYRLVFTAPSGSALTYAPKNNASVFAGGSYALAALTPGTGATGVSVYVTDTTAPIASIASLTGAITVGADRVNPTGAAFAGTDAGTSVTDYAWEIRQGTTVVTSGTATAASPAMTVPTTLADGAYTLVVTATDLAKNVSPETSAAFVVDKTAPVLSSSANSSTYTKGGTVPANAQAWINLYGVTSADTGVGMPAAGGITVDFSAVRASAGTYSVKFTGKDAAGNTTAAYNVSYVVAYVGDPVLTPGKNSTFYEMGAAQPTTPAAWSTLFGGVTITVGPGATAGALAADSSAVDFGTAGSYPVVFSSTDSLGYGGTATATLVVRDTIAPAMTLANSTISFNEGDAKPTTDADFITLFGAVATDGGSGVASTAVNWSAVNFARAGDYSVLFTATDNAGNVTSPAVVGTYSVKFAGSPVVSLDKASVTHEVGAKAPTSKADWIELFGATAVAAPGATIASIAVDTSQVTATALTTPGTYIVTFTATDNNGVKGSTTAQFVVRDTTKPTAKLGETSVKHVMAPPATAYSAQDWVDLFGASASDGDGTGVDASTWTVTEGVNFSVEGSYPITFTVSDKAGNVSDKVTGTLVVQAPPSSETVAVRIAQNSSANLDPIALAKTTGTLQVLGTAQLGTPDQGGTLALSSGRVVYTSAKDYAGDETFVVTVVDDLGQTGSEIYTITVVSKPTIAADTVFEYTVPQDGGFSINNVPGLAGLVSGSALAVTGINTPSDFHGAVTFDDSNVTFAADASNFAGVQVFTFTVEDDLGQQLEVPVQVTVAAPTLAIDKTQGAAGKTQLTVTTTGLVPGKVYAVEFHSTPVPIGSITAAVDGSGSLAFTVPAGAEVGSHHVVLLNDAQIERARSAFTVLAEGGGTGGGGTGDSGSANGSGSQALLERTGSDTAGLGLAAVLLLLTGLAALAIRRRRGGAVEG